MSASGSVPGNHPRGKGLPSPATGNLAQSAAALLWIGQAALLACAVQRLADGGGLGDVVGPALGFLAVGVARASVEAWGARQAFAAARAEVTRLRAGTAAALAQRSPMDRERPASGEAASALAEQAEAVLPSQLRYQVARCKVMVVPPVIALAVAFLSWTAALILVLAAPLIPVFMALIGWRAQAASEKQLTLVGGMNGFLLDRLRGLSSLRALGAVDTTARRLRDMAQSVRSSTMRVLRIAFLSSTALELFSALAVALVAVYVGFHLLHQVATGTWGRQLDLGEGLFILLLAPAFFEPLRELAAAWHDKAAGAAALDALDRMCKGSLPLPGALDACAGQQHSACTPLAPRVDIRGLRFAHGGEASLYDGWDLHIAAGEHVALVGGSGSGKTTLLSLIAGLAPPSGGSIRIDGVPLDERNAAGLRARMAWIGQKPHVFPGTVRDNVSLGRHEIAPSDVTAAIRHAGLGHVVHAMADADLGEGGTGMSGGELVRLALARAAVAPQAGLLLADEPTAHLDRATADGVIDALLDLARGRTLIVATHDLALAARIGRIVAIGDAAEEAAA